MTATEKQSNNLMIKDNEKNDRHMKPFFNVLKANVVRTRITMTAAFLTIQKLEDVSKEHRGEFEQEITAFIETKIRQTDLLFKLSNPFEWCILLSQSGEEETNAFLSRLFLTLQDQVMPLFTSDEIFMVASIAEIGNSNVKFEDLIEHGRAGLQYSLKQNAWHIEYIPNFKMKEIEKVKVSILEENEIFSNVLNMSLEGLVVEGFELEIQLFKDGYEFIESSFFHSSHTHILIMNDILPKKNGLDVLQALRKLPNEKKFIIFMMTKRKSEADMLYAYEKGVDEYLIKPFNLRLFEAQIRRTFERLWS